MKIKIGLKSHSSSDSLVSSSDSLVSSSSDFFSDSDNDKKVSGPPKISINSKKEPSIDHPALLSSECDLDRHIRDYFLEPLKDLINNDGVSNGFLIANVDALLIMKKILKSILKKKKISIVEILEKAAFEDATIQAAEVNPSVEIDVDELRIKILSCKNRDELTYLYKSNSGYKQHAALFTEMANALNAKPNE